jgi:hypothetical protein
LDGEILFLIYLRSSAAETLNIDAVSSIELFSRDVINSRRFFFESFMVYISIHYTFTFARGICALFNIAGTGILSSL